MKYHVFSEYAAAAEIPLDDTPLPVTNLNCCEVAESEYSWLNSLPLPALPFPNRPSSVDIFVLLTLTQPPRVRSDVFARLAVSLSNIEAAAVMSMRARPLTMEEPEIWMLKSRSVSAGQTAVICVSESI